jgi:hypothetical protein
MPNLPVERVSAHGAVDLGALQRQAVRDAARSNGTP